MSYSPPGNDSTNFEVISAYTPPGNDTTDFVFPTPLSAQVLTSTQTATQTATTNLQSGDITVNITTGTVLKDQTERVALLTGNISATFDTQTTGNINQTSLLTGRILFNTDTETVVDESLQGEILPQTTLAMRILTTTQLTTLVDRITNIVRATERVIKYGLSATPRPVERTLKDKRREVDLER